MNDNLFSVKDRIVVITGANRGIGAAIGEGFLNHSAVVVSVGRSKPSYLNKSPSLFYELDLKDKNKIESVISKIGEHFGKIDILINAAGVTHSDETAESWDDTLNINLSAAYHMCRFSLPLLKKSDAGSVINITSISAEIAFPDNPSYQASKGGLKMLSKALAYDWAKYGIRVNSLCPGYVVTDMTIKSFNDPEKNKQRTERTLLNRWGKPEEFVGPTIFLASKAAAYVTGTEIIVDGGWTAKGL